eukprot:2989016-Rhodomonas_salina.2
MRARPGGRRKEGMAGGELGGGEGRRKMEDAREQGQEGRLRREEVGEGKGGEGGSEGGRERKREADRSKQRRTERGRQASGRQGLGGGREGDRETGRQGDRETGRQGDRGEGVREGDREGGRVPGGGALGEHLAMLPSAGQQRPGRTLPNLYQLLPFPAAADEDEEDEAPMLKEDTDGDRENA